MQWNYNQRQGWHQKRYYQYQIEYNHFTDVIQVLISRLEMTFDPERNGALLCNLIELDWTELLTRRHVSHRKLLFIENGDRFEYQFDLKPCTVAGIWLQDTLQGSLLRKWTIRSRDLDLKTVVSWIIVDRLDPPSSQLSKSCLTLNNTTQYSIKI